MATAGPRCHAIIGPRLHFLCAFSQGDRRGTVCVCVRACASVGVWGLCVRVFVHLCVCVCVFVRQGRERERERESEGGREKAQHASQRRTLPTHGEKQ